MCYDGAFVYVCYDGAFEEPKQVSFADSEATEPAPVSYYGVGSQESEVTRDESSDIAEEVHKSLLLEKKCFQLAIDRTRHGNREKSSRRRRLKIVHGLLLLMRTC